jgi:flagellar motor switch protein FliN/FliY
MSDETTQPVTGIEPEAVLDVTVRFWAELGRARMPLGHAVALAEGSIVDLDRGPEDAVDVFVNGAPFGVGRLILVEGEWALQLERVYALDGVEQASTGSSETG